MANILRKILVRFLIFIQSFQVKANYSFNIKETLQSFPFIAT